MGGRAKSAVEKAERPFLFQRPVVATVEGWPGAMRVTSVTLSRFGMFLRTEAPPPVNARVKLALEAGGRVLPFAEGLVSSALPKDWAFAHGRIAGFSVEFEQLPPRSQALVHALRLRLQRLAVAQAKVAQARRAATRPVQPSAVLSAERPEWRAKQRRGPRRATVAGFTTLAFLGAAAAAVAGSGLWP